jgi:hypothetical protein
LIPSRLETPIRTLTALAAGLAVLLAPSGALARKPASRPPQRRPALLLGFNTYTTPTTIEKQLAVGARITRLFVDWTQVEPRPGVFEWASFDTQYRELLAAGIRPLIVAFDAPCWTHVAYGCDPLYASPPAPAFDTAWREYVSALAMRYPDAIGIEIWNEPNTTAEFYPRADPRRYTQLLQEAYTAVRAVGGSMPLISGGLAMNDASGQAVTGYASATFLADMFADGARRWMNGLGIHVYPSRRVHDGYSVWDPSLMSSRLAQVADAARAAHVKMPPIWVTEMGVSTTTQQGFPLAATPYQQAVDLVTMVASAAADSHVRAVVVDSLQDAAPQPLLDLLGVTVGVLTGDDPDYLPEMEGLGVFTDSWTPKPAACALSDMFGGTLRCPV